MTPYAIKLLRRDDIAVGTTAFYFEKPSGFSFTAGQYIDITLVDPPETDAEGNTRSFSIASAPHEPELMIASRMRDTAFKRVLGSMPIGSTVQITLAMGSLTLHRDTAKPAVFLAGGIGITPFFSMIKDATERKLPHHITLFYSNKRPEDAAFLKKLINLQKENPNFTFVPTMTEIENSDQPWEGKTGFIDAAMLKEYTAYHVSPIYYIAGPPMMVAAMRNMLEGAGANPDNIRVEDFTGY